MRFLLPLSVGFFLSLIPLPAEAQGVIVCPIPGLPCGAGGFTGAALYTKVSIWPYLRYLFIGIAFAMLFYYAAMLLIAGGDEQTITDVKSSYGYAVIGAALVSLSSIIVDSFGPVSSAIGLGVGVDFIKQTEVRTALDNIILGFRVALATAVAINLTIQGIRMIALQGNEGEMENQKKRFLYGLLGVALILLVTPLVNSVAPGSNSGILADEIRGVANFLLVFFGFLVVVGVIIGGVMIVVSTEEGLKDKGKKLIFSCIITLIIVSASYSIVRLFLT